MKEKELANSLKKLTISIIIFLLFVTIVFYYIFKNNDMSAIYRIIKNSKKIYLLLAIICMACFSIGEALNLRRTLKLFGNKVCFKNAYKYALGGFFASSITPSSSGGDPMQLYMMTKDDLPISHSVLALLIKLLSFQFVVIIMSIVSFICSYNLFKDLGWLKYIIYLGIFLNTVVFSFYLFTIFCKQIIIFLENVVCKCLNFFHYKKTAMLKEKIDYHIREYDNINKVLKKNPRVLVFNILTTLLQMLLYYSIAYLIYLSFGLNKVGLLTFISLQSVNFIAVSFLPFPGAVGASEYTFIQFYKAIYGNKLLESAMLITRFINFYMFVFYSGIVIIIYLLKKWRHKN